MVASSWVTPTPRAGSRTAPNACSACWSRKRRCDRHIPTCFRCVRSRLWCTYSNCDAVVVRASWAVFSGSRGLMTRLTSRDVDQRITSEMHSLLSCWHTDAITVIACHRDSLHTWLPIIHPKHLSHAVEELAVTPCAEVATLVLHLFLANPRFSICGTRSSESVKSLYDTCKSLFSYMQVLRQGSLATIQAGLLLAVYELGEGLLSDARVTIKTCAELWTSSSKLQQHRQVVTGHPLGHNEVQCVSWAIYALDRLHSLESGELHKATILDAFTANHDLPSLNSWLSTPSTAKPDVLSKRIRAFGYQIRAFHLLDRVRTFNLTGLPDGRDELWQQQVNELDAILHQGITDVFDGVVGDQWVAPYPAIIVIYCALIELHTNVIKSHHTPTSPHDDTMLARSSLALETVISMTRDIARMDDMNNLNIMPLGAVVLLRSAAVTALSLSTRYRRPTMDALPDVLGSLERAKRRWGVAGLFASSFSMPSSDNDSFKPLDVGGVAAPASTAA